MSILAHAFGARYDLPVPLLYFVTGGAAVVFLSFLLVLPREVAVPEQPEAPDGSFVPRNRPVPAAIGLLGLGVLVVAGIIGSQEIPENIVPTAFWLVIWIAVPISCGVAGDWTPWSRKAEGAGPRQPPPNWLHPERGSSRHPVPGRSAPRRGAARPADMNRRPRS